MLLSKIHLLLLFTVHKTKNIAYHITEALIFYAYKLKVMAVPKICVYLISRFYWHHENHKNLMLAKYTCFIVCVTTFNEIPPDIKGHTDNGKTIVGCTTWKHNALQLLLLPDA